MKKGNKLFSGFKKGTLGTKSNMLKTLLKRSNGIKVIMLMRSSGLSFGKIKENIKEMVEEGLLTEEYQGLRKKVAITDAGRQFLEDYKAGKVKDGQEKE